MILKYGVYIYVYDILETMPHDTSSHLWPYPEESLALAHAGSQPNALGGTWQAPTREKPGEATVDTGESARENDRGRSTTNQLPMVYINICL